MASSRNYDELYWVWDGWRDAVGAPARDDYERYVELKNKAALANGKDEGASSLIIFVNSFTQQNIPIYHWELWPINEIL